MIKMFPLIKGLLRPRFEKIVGQKLYVSCVNQARLPTFYLELGVEDQKGARFEMLNLHVGLIVIRLRKIAHDHPQYEQAKDTAQALFDRYLLALDTTLREDGVGDLSVPKKMKKLSALIYTRFQAWSEILEKDFEAEAAENYLKRTVYAGTALDPNYEEDAEDLRSIEPHKVSALAHYVRDSWHNMNIPAILEARLKWKQPDEVAV